MYSILPAAVSVLFLAYGFYALGSRGVNRITLSFSLLCLTTFFWHATWAVLFQVKDPATALFLIKFGYFFILFLPSSMYHFLVEISGRYQDRRYVYASYGLAVILAVFLFSSNLFVSGYYQYFWGYYPKAGPLHLLHLFQTILVLCRGLFIALREQGNASGNLRMRLRLCIAGTSISFFAAFDYLCNYGVEFYPPGVIFVMLTLGIFTVAIVRYDLFNPLALAGSIAHEMRAPLSSIRSQTVGMASNLPVLLEGYRLAVEHNLMEASISPASLNILSDISRRISEEVTRSNTIIDMLLASVSMQQPDSSSFKRYFIAACINEALERYPFNAGEREKISVNIAEDFEYWGDDGLLALLLFNLLKNSLYALEHAGKGEIQIELSKAGGCNMLIFTDTGSGIPAKVLPHIFDDFYTTKRGRGGGTGIGLSFCKKVMTAFKGMISCDSREGEYTTFVLEFPPL